MVKFQYLELLQQFLNFHLDFVKINNFQPQSTHNYVTPWPIVMILACMDRGDPNLYCGSYRGMVTFNVSQKMAPLDEV